MGMSNQNSIHLILLFSLYLGKILAENSSSSCGDWEPYTDEKCFKIFDSAGLQPFEAAQKLCHQQENGSSLLTIRSLEEQKFFSNWFFKKEKMVDNVWIGANYTNNKYKWSDGSELGFTNWVEGSPKNKSDYCVQMHSDEASIGKWVDEPCKKRNLVVCQKMQTWSNSYLHNKFSELKEKLIDTEKELNDTRNRWEILITNFQSFSTNFYDSTNRRKIFALPRNDTRNIDKIKREEAEKICSNVNGTLPSIESEEINSLLIKFLNQHSKSDWGQYLTSGRVINGKIQWANIQNLTNFTNWHSGSEKNENNSCVTLWIPKGSAAFWDTEKGCEYSYDLVCEIPLI